MTNPYAPRTDAEVVAAMEAEVATVDQMLSHMGARPSDNARRLTRHKAELQRRLEALRERLERSEIGDALRRADHEVLAIVSEAEQVLAMANGHMAALLEWEADLERREQIVQEAVTNMRKVK
jgi:uncharacterized protein YgbK (DUF1537 family)